MNRGDLGCHAFGAHHCSDSVDGFARQRRHILAVVDREVCLAVGLVGCERTPRLGTDDVLADRHETRPGRLPLGVFAELRVDEVDAALAPELTLERIRRRLDRPRAVRDSLVSPYAVQEHAKVPLL